MSKVIQEISSLHSPDDSRGPRNVLMSRPLSVACSKAVVENKSGVHIAYQATGSKDFPDFLAH